MRREFHVRFWEGGGVRLPSATRLVGCFQSVADAEGYGKALPKRLGKFGLEIAPDKTRCIEFGRFARENARKRGQKPEEFTFLGFTHYCGKTKEGYFKVKRRTSRKKLRLCIARFTEWARRSRCVMRKVEMLQSTKRKIEGHLNYYAITDNSAECGTYLYHVTRIVFKWLNRKSQRRTYTWEGFEQVLRWMEWPRVEIRKDLNPCRRPALQRAG